MTGGGVDRERRARLPLLPGVGWAPSLPGSLSTRALEPSAPETEEGSCSAVYNMHFFAQIFERKIRMHFTYE